MIVTATATITSDKRKEAIELWTRAMKYRNKKYPEEKNEGKAIYCHGQYGDELLRGSRITLLPVHG